jgi:hypothetical protein
VSAKKLFCSNLIDLMESLHSMFPECEKTKVFLETCTSSVKSDLQSTMIMCVWSSQAGKFLDRIDAKDETLLDEDITVLCTIGMKDKWNDAGFSNLSKDYFWLYLQNLSKCSQVWENPDVVLKAEVNAIDTPESSDERKSNSGGVDITQNTMDDDYGSSTKDNVEQSMPEILQGMLQGVANSLPTGGTQQTFAALCDALPLSLFQNIERVATEFMDEQGTELDLNNMNINDLLSGLEPGDLGQRMLSGLEPEEMLKMCSNFQNLMTNLNENGMGSLDQLMQLANGNIGDLAAVFCQNTEMKELVSKLNLEPEETLEMCNNFQNLVTSLNDYDLGSPEQSMQLENTDIRDMTHSVIDQVNK